MFDFDTFSVFDDLPPRVAWDEGVDFARRPAVWLPVARRAGEEKGEEKRE